jgi:RNA polymerase sigma-70 factor, ECF subfamily
MNFATSALQNPSNFHPALLGEMPGATPATASVAISWHDMVSHRDYLVRFAQRKLHDPMLAEDVVHDVFEAVLSGRALFAGRSALRSWLTAVLKNKIVDLIRQRASWDSLDALDDDEDSSSPAIAAIECPHARPDELAEHRQLLSLTLARITALPAGLREVMEKRVLMDLSADEVCEQLSISEDNLFVRLHRARKQLLS